MKEKELLILHVDDDEDDLFIIGEALKNAHHSLQIVGASDGHEALRYLQQSTETPNLIILDINMPGMDGRETLKHLKHHEHWKTIPTVVLSTSNDPLDKQFCNSFQVELVTKPMEITEVRKTAQALLNYIPV
jgi:CheY-like chemotaxis protein